MLERVKTMQDQTWQLQHNAGQTVAKAHEDTKRASDSENVDQTELAKSRQLVRKAKWMWDIVTSESSMGFHNTYQSMTTLGQANELAHQAIEAANRAAGIKVL